MARRRRTAPGGLAAHVTNRSSGNLILFEDAGDFAALERVLSEARIRGEMRVCCYTLMPNHFHLVL